MKQVQSDVEKEMNRSETNLRWNLKGRPRDASSGRSCLVGCMRRLRNASEMVVVTVGIRTSGNFVMSAKSQRWRGDFGFGRP